MQTQPRTIITLTTDFGLEDEYVGVVKGVLACRAPQAQIIDICHTVPPFNLSKAACQIAAAYRFFPAGTIHLVVVDPGVGSDRGILLLQTESCLFLAPNNGVLSLVFKENPSARIYQITDTKTALQRHNATFHGRDIFAPLAARLANGARPEDVGHRHTTIHLLPHINPLVETDRTAITAAVLDIDHFGNITTNITADMVEKLNLQDTSFTLSMNTAGTHRLSRFYGEVSPGEVAILVNSRNYLEIAVNCGNAAQKFGVTMDSIITLTRKVP